MPEEFKNATITGQFGFVFEENSVREITWLSWRHRFRKAPFSKCFLSTRKRKSGVFKFLLYEERFHKAPFAWRIIVGDRPNRRNNCHRENKWPTHGFFYVSVTSSSPYVAYQLLWWFYSDCSFQDATCKQTNKQTNKFSHLLTTQSPTQQISPIEPSLCT